VSHREGVAKAWVKGGICSSVCLLLLALLLNGSAAEAAEPGGISGTVTDVTTSNPVANVEVCAFLYYPEEEAPCVETDGNGDYTISGLEPMAYHVRFHPASTSDLAYQYYEDATTWETSQTVAVAGSVVSGIDAALHPGGAISGTTENTSSNPVGNVVVCVYEAEGWVTGPCLSSNGSGEYTAKNLPAGSYKVEFAPLPESNYAHQWYDTEAEFEEADSVSVSTSSTTTGVNSNLRQAGKISGQVTDSSNGHPIEDIEVCANVTGGVYGEGLYHLCTTTDSGGNYVLDGLASLYFEVSFAPVDVESENYVKEFYDNKKYFYESDAVQVTAPTTTSGIDAALDPGGSIEGTVDDHDTAAALSGTEVCAEEAGGQIDDWGCSTTDGAGHYKISGLASQQYRVRFWSPVGSGYLYQLYDEASTFYGADLVTVSAPNTVTGIDGHLFKEGAITGHVEDEATGDPIVSSWVCAYRENFHDPEYETCTRTNASGDYRIGGLNASEYSIEFDASHQGYEIEYYDDKPFASPDMVTVEYGTTLSGIDAALIANPRPINEERPIISGNLEVGEMLTCSTGTWKNSPTSFSYQWQRNGSPIAGETSSEYVVQGADVEAYLTCEVTAENDEGTGTATSEWAYVPEIPATAHTLTVHIAGEAPGSVSSNPAGISCGPTCAQSYEEGTLVTLTQDHGAGTVFDGWSGACSGTGNCVVEVDEDLEVTATFSIEHEEGGSESEGGQEGDGSGGSGAGGGGSASSATPSPSSQPAPSALEPSVGVAGAQAVVDGSVALLTTRCVGAEACKGLAKLVVGLHVPARNQAHSSRRLHRRVRELVIGKGRFNIPAGKRGRIRIKLTGKGKGLLRKAGKHGLVARLVGTGLRNRAVKLIRTMRKRRGARDERRQRRRGQIGFANSRRPLRASRSLALMPARPSQRFRKLG
jgi:List-Bact-rpt repeat protein